MFDPKSRCLTHPASIWRRVEDDGGAKEEPIQMGIDELGLTDMIEGLEAMIDMVAEGAIEAASGLMEGVFGLIGDSL